MEQEQPESTSVEASKSIRYIYQPYVLCLLHQKVIYLEKIRKLCQLRATYNKEDEKTHLIKSNYYAEQIVSDVFHLMQRMSSEKYPLDIYHCNFEYILFRMFSLFYPRDAPTIPAKLAQHGALFYSELKCSEVTSSYGFYYHSSKEGAVRTNEQTNNKIIFDLIERYITKYYFLNLVNYDKNVIHRVSLLFNIKQMTEEKIEHRQYDTHYSVHYDANVVVTMMYVFFMNEFRSMLLDEKSLLQLRHHKTNEEDSQRIIKEIDHKIGLVESLYDLLVNQLDEEFRGYALIDIQPTADADATIARRYTTVTIQNQHTIYTVKDTSSDTTVVKEKDCSHLKYISMRRNRQHYECITMRFMFDHALACIHSDYCSLEGKKDDNTRICHICNYFLESHTLKTFYEMSESYTYNTCHYTYLHNKELDNETRLTTYLGTLVVDPIRFIDAVIYKNAWQLINLFYDGGEDSRLFHMISIGEMIRHIVEEDGVLDGGAERRTEEIMRVSRNNKKSFHHIEKWQKRFVRDIDIMLLITRASKSQANEIDKYERTISPTLLLLASDYRIRDSVTSELWKLYQFYCDVFNNLL